MQIGITRVSTVEECVGRGITSPSVEPPDFNIEGLTQQAYQRLESLTRMMLRRYPTVKRWEQTDDVLQQQEEHHVVFDLLYYNGLSQREAAGILGIAERVLQRRWRATKIRLARLIKV